MEKQKKYDWKDTNMALFGSDLEKKIKAAAAEGEPQWTDAGKKVGLQVWRIVNFKVTEWPKKQYGSFYEGDSYIILNTYLKDPEAKKFSYDVHFWIGKYSTQDEYGTAAYKTVELDHLLGDVAVQHREVMGNETELFLSYFPKGLKLMKGGADSGFTHAETNAGVEAKPSLWWVKGTKGNFVLKEVKISRKNMNSGDVFILDIGNEVWQWNGKSSNAFEKLKAEEFIRSLQADRGGPGRCDMHMLEEGEDDEEKAPQFCRYLPTHKGVMLGMVQVDVNVAPADKGGNDEDVKPFVPTLSELRGINFVEVAKAPPHTRIAQYMLRETHVYVLDTGFQLYVWIGNKADSSERSKAMHTAHEYLEKHNRPFILPITRTQPGHESKDFTGYFDPAAVEPPKACCTIM